jgi:hypothetical protein
MWEVAVCYLKGPVMTTRFESYGRTFLGRRLAEIVTAPERYAECRAFSREGFPAVTALVSLIRPELERVQQSNRPEFNEAKQFVGWMVARVMRYHRHKIVGRSRVPGGLFTVGTIWTADPATDELAAAPARNKSAA